MTAKLFVALYIGLIAGMSILLIFNIPIAWVYFGFLFVALFGGFLYADRPDLIAAGFLLVSLIVLGVGLFYNQNTTEDWITLTVGAFMSGLSGFTLYWVLRNPLPPIKINKDKGYAKMDQQEFLHQLSVDTDVNIELFKDLFQNEEFEALIRAGKIIDATILLRSIQPSVGLREAKMVVEAFAERKAG